MDGSQHHATPPKALATTRFDVLKQLNEARKSADIADGLRAICAYAGAAYYLLARWDIGGDDGSEFIISADWPYDLVRRLGSAFIRAHSKAPEIERSLSIMSPVFVECPVEMEVPSGLSRRICKVSFDLGGARFSLLLCFQRDAVIAKDRLNDIGTLCAYHLDGFEPLYSASRQFVLTERELECLAWIAEGKTSHEISLIIGISRNTVNNYITSIMRKTATRTRSEAVAYAVRNNMV